MAEAEERIELKFRIYDGADIAHSNYAPSTTVATLKQRLVTEWPQGYCFFFYKYMLFFSFDYLLCTTDPDQCDF